MKSILLWASPGIALAQQAPPGDIYVEEGEEDLADKVAFIDDSKTPTGVAEVPLTDISVEAFSSQVELAGPGQWLFPSDGNRTGHQTEFKKGWGTGPALKSLPFRPLSKKRQLDQKCRTNAAFGFETECAPVLPHDHGLSNRKPLARTLSHRRRQLGPHVHRRRAPWPTGPSTTSSPSYKETSVPRRTTEPASARRARAPGSRRVLRKSPARHRLESPPPATSARRSRQCSTWARPPLRATSRP